MFYGRTRPQDLNESFAGMAELAGFPNVTHWPALELPFCMAWHKNGAVTLLGCFQWTFLF